MRRAVGDTGISLLKGAIGVPEAAVGAADLVSGGQAGKLAQDLGFRPKEAKSLLDELYSPEQQAANRKVQQAEGFVNTAVAAVQNPSTILHAAVESAPSLLPAGAVARGVMAAAPRVGGAIAAGIGEGVVSAAQTAEQVRQETSDGLLTGEQSALAAGSGALTGLIGAAAGKVANRLGIGDINQLVAGVKNADPAVQKGVIRSLVEGFATEGILQELPQSAQEQIAQNVALGKPWDEGVGNAAAMGALAGGLMGGAAAPFGHGSVSRPSAEEMAQDAQQRLASATSVSDMISAASDLASVPLDLPTPAAPVTPDVPVSEQPVPFERFSFGTREAADEYLARHGTDWVTAQKADGSWSFVMADQPASGASAGTDGVAQRVSQLRQQLAEPSIRERVREKLGDEALQTLLYYAQAANRKDVPAKTSERMIGLAEMILDRSVLQPIRQPAGVSSAEFGNEALIAPPAVQQIPLDTTPTGTIRVDAAGTAAPEVRADVINTNQALAQGRTAVADASALGQPGRKASAVWADPKPRMPAPPLNMPERRNTDAVMLEPVEPADPVAEYVQRVGASATPAGRAFAQDFRAGRITRQDVIRVMQSQAADPLSQEAVSFRLEAAASQAPAPAPAEAIQPAKVYRSRSAAFVQARKVGGIVEQEGNGFIVSEGDADGQRDMALPAAQPVQADAARGNLAGGRGGDLGLRADNAGGGVQRASEAPVAGRAGDLPAGVDAGRGGQLNAQAAIAQGSEAAAAARPAAAAAPAVVSGARGAGDVQAAGLTSTPVDAAAHGAATSPTNATPEPTQAQKEAGNYKVGRIRVAGLDISVENPQGSTRRGVDRDGKAWENTLQHHYGYIRGTVGADKDHVDVFVKAGTPEDFGGQVFVVDQVDPSTGRFDEHKALIGFDTEQEARDAYAANYAKGWMGLKSITAMPVEEFKTWARDQERTKKPVAGDAGGGSASPPAVAQEAAAAAPAPVADAAATDAAMAQAGESAVADEVVKAKRGDVPPAGMRYELARQLAAAYEDAGLQRVNVARSISDLPPSLQKKLSGFGDDVRGAYFPKEDEIWILSDRVGSADELAFVVMHEAFHRGVGTLLGDNARRVMRQMYQTNKTLRDRADSVMRELKVDRDTAIEEALADMAGEGDATKLRGWSRLAKLITDWLNKIGEAVGINRTFTDKEIETFVSAMARAGINRDPDAQSRRDGFDPDAVEQGAEVKASRAAALPLPQNEPATEAAANTKAGWKLDESTRLDNLIYEIQDKLVDTKQAVKAIREAVGKISDEFDPYLQEELYHGRAAKQTSEFLQQEVQPLLAELGKSGSTMQDLETFLHARHAEERNEQVAKINPSMPDGGSGMKTAEARRYLASLSPEQRATLERLAGMVDAITAGTRQYLVESGLESQEVVKAWEGAYKHYVPLQRADVEADGSMRGTGAGFSVRGSSAKRAMGSDREVDNILANVVMQRERAITRGEKNRVATAVYGLAIKAPNKGFWRAVDPDANGRTPAELKDLEAELVDLGLNPADAESVFKEPKQRYIDPKTGLVSERINPVMRSANNVLALRVNGKDRFVFFSDRDPRAVRMVTALKNLDAPQMGEMMGLAAKITRYFSAINTSYNPIFGMVNLVRDFQSALFNQSTTAIAGQEKDVARHVPAAMKGIMLSLRARRRGESADSSWARLFDEFEQAGGRTGYRDMYATAQDRANQLEKEIKRASSTEAKGIYAMRSAFQMLEDYNDTMENALRLSAYKVARDQGLSKEQAASLAKNLTVNFNRKGHLTSQVGALYAFFNASAQGTARLAETMRGPRGKKILAGGMLLGTLQALMMAAAGFDDDQPPEFVRERNFIIPIGDGQYLAVPMPLGLHVIPNLTRVPTEWALGGFKGTGERISSMLGLLFDTFNPIGSAGMSIQTVAPTILDPFVALSENRDFAGRAIAKEDFGQTETPGFTRKRDTASAWAQGVSYAINWLTGGTDFKPGAFSPTPDQIDYLVGQGTGGVGREISKVAQSVMAAYDGEELASHKIPLLGRLYGDTKEAAAVSGSYYAVLRDMRLHAQEVKGLREERGDVAGYLAANPDARLAPLAVATEKKVSSLRKLKRAMEEKGSFTAEQMRVVDRRMQAEMERLTSRVREARAATGG